MAGVVIEESGMKFGEYNNEDVFHIENSGTYISMFREKDTKTVEFVLCHNDDLIFLEAKTSTPNYKNAATEENKRKYDKFVSAINQKFCNSVDLYFSTLLGRHGKPEISQKLLGLDYSNINVLLVIVIRNGSEYKDSLRHYQEKFNKNLRTKMNLWRISRVLVIDEETARKKGLII